MQNKKRSRQRAFLLCLRIETATHGRGISGKGYNGHIVSFGVSGMILWQGHRALSQFVGNRMS